jgi:predicted DNA-binding protein (MmcQ/YjbR family)
LRAAAMGAPATMRGGGGCCVAAGDAAWRPHRRYAATPQSPSVVPMTPNELRDFCLALVQAVEEFPFDDETSVFKTSGNNKIFAISALHKPLLDVSLKCDPEDSIALRNDYAAITPGYHLNKKHWVTVQLDGSVPRDLVEQLIAESHRLVAPKTPRSRLSD